MALLYGQSRQERAQYGDEGIPPGLWGLLFGTLKRWVEKCFGLVLRGHHMCRRHRSAHLPDVGRVLKEKFPHISAEDKNEFAGRNWSATDSHTHADAISRLSDYSCHYPCCRWELFPLASGYTQDALTRQGWSPIIPVPWRPISNRHWRITWWPLMTVTTTQDCGCHSFPTCVITMFKRLYA